MYMINNKYNPNAYQKLNQNIPHSTTTTSGGNNNNLTHYTDAFSKRFSDPRVTNYVPVAKGGVGDDESWVKYKKLLSELFPDENHDDEQTLMMSPNIRPSPLRN